MAAHSLILFFKFLIRVADPKSSELKKLLWVCLDFLASVFLSKLIDMLPDSLEELLFSTATMDLIDLATWG